jgi:hypothetical protein
MVRNNVIDGYKRLAVAISNGNISRVHSLLAVELRNAAGVLQKTDQAAPCSLVYHAKSYIRRYVEAMKRHLFVCVNR